MADAPIRAAIVDRWTLSRGDVDSARGSRWPRWLPIYRASLELVLRRRIVWLFLGIGLINFLFYAAVVYLLADLEAELQQRGMAEGLLRSVAGFEFQGSGRSYQEFIYAQNIVVMLLLAFAGTVLVGNDFRYRSVAFYLSKPIDARHYFLGKFMACATLTAVLTLLPALVLFVQYGVFTESLLYFVDHWRVLVGIVCYGTMVCVIMSALLLAVGALFRRPIQIVAVWVVLNVFPFVACSVVRRIGEERTGQDPWAWGALDVWSDMRWIAKWIFGIEAEVYAARLPLAIPIVCVVLLASLGAFWWSLRRVEVVR